MKSLSRKSALRAGAMIGWVCGLVFFFRRKVCYTNLKIAFGDTYSMKEKKKILSKMYVNLGKNAVDFMRLPLINKDNFSRYVHVDGEEHIIRAKEKGKGVLGVTAHFGFWDIIPLLFGFKEYGANLITKEIRNPSVNAFWMQYRRYGGVNPIFKKNSSREIISVLKKNECLGFVIDQNMNTRSGVFVDFFSKKACTLDVVAKLALSFGCPVLPMFCIRNDDETFTIRIEKPVPVVEGKDKEETVRLTTQAYSNVFEGFVKDRPDHWIWMHKRWKTRPEGEAKIYK